jgi:hypothetical protein
LPEPLRTGERVVNLETLFEGNIDFGSDTYANFPNNIDIELGATYLVTINGQKFESTAKAIYKDVVIGNGRAANDNWIYNNTGEPFGIVADAIYLVRGLAEEERGVNSITIQKKNMIVNTIDAKYIPDTIARVTDIPDHSWSTLKNRPFYAETVYSASWDGDTAGTSSITHEEKPYYRLTGIVSSYPGHLLDATYTLNVNGTEQEITISDDDVYNNKISTDYGYIIKDFYIVYYHPTLPSGLYGYYKNDGDQHIRVSRITATQKCFIKVHTLDIGFLPKATAVADVTDTPTAEEFNALLASLRAAGYLTI